MTTAEIITSVTGVITTTATVAAVVIAGLGLKTWSKQLKGTHQYACAKELLSEVYRIRNSITYMRSPVPTKGNPETIQDIHDVELEALLGRFNQLMQNWANLSVAMEEAEIVLKKDYAKLNDLYGKLREFIEELKQALYHFIDEHVNDYADVLTEDDKQILKNISVSRKTLKELLRRHHEDKYDERINALLRALIGSYSRTYQSDLM